MPLGAVTVYCGSSPGKSPRFQEAAKALGEYLGKNKIDLVYGGGLNGLMGAVAQSASDMGGNVTGYIPEFFLNSTDDTLVEARDRGKVGQTVVMPDMHTRKKNMIEKSDALIALPGGFGTMDELMEVITWLQLGLHKKPVGILNIDNYYGGFLDWLDHAIKEGFVASQTKKKLIVAGDCETLMQKIREQFIKG